LTPPKSLNGQQTLDFQVHTLAMVFADRFLGGGAGLSVRPPGKSGVYLNASAGDLGGSLAARFEGLATFHLNPERQRGFTPYVAGGIAANVSRPANRGYIEILMGVEERPGRPSGLFLELGLGGGMRLAAGYRFRSGKGISRGRQP
jgi:hypothetical protein